MTKKYYLDEKGYVTFIAQDGESMVTPVTIPHSNVATLTPELLKDTPYNIRFDGKLDNDFKPVMIIYHGFIWETIEKNKLGYYINGKTVLADIRAFEVQDDGTIECYLNINEDALLRWSDDFGNNIEELNFYYNLNFFSMEMKNFTEEELPSS